MTLAGLLFRAAAGVSRDCGSPGGSLAVFQGCLAAGYNGQRRSVMTYRGRLKNGVVVLGEDAKMPEVTEARWSKSMTWFRATSGPLLRTADDTT